MIVERDSWGSLLSSLADARRLVEALAEMLRREPIIAYHEPRVRLEYVAEPVEDGVCIEAQLVIELRGGDAYYGGVVRLEVLDKLSEVLELNGLSLLGARSSMNGLELLVKYDRSSECLAHENINGKRLIELLKRITGTFD